jgi:predicted membrane chloride channel (bestrophin family)
MSDEVPVALTSAEDEAIIKRLHDAAVAFANAAAMRLPAQTAEDLLNAVDRGLAFTVAVEVTPPYEMALVMREHGSEEPRVLMRIEHRPSPGDVH